MVETERDLLGASDLDLDVEPEDDEDDEEGA